MRIKLLAAATAAALSLGAVAAEAAPVVVVPAVAPQVVLVGGGCGFGFQRGPYGGCVRGGYVARRIFPLYRGICAPHRTAFGWPRICR